MPKLICLMPTYNKEKTLAKAIESVLMQKTDFEYKLIILDDCSTDNSNQIAKEYQEKHPNKIEIIRNETNQQLLKTITNGYKMLKGADYFCVLDADDYYIYDKKFADAVTFLDKHKNYTMYLTNVICKTKNGGFLWYRGKKRNYDFDFKKRKKNKDIFIQTSGVIYRNIYFHSGEHLEFEQVQTLTFQECYRADGFRHEWYLKAGKAHFVNHAQSVYDYSDGIWASLSKTEQNLFNVTKLLACAEFMPDEKLYYLKEAKKLLQETFKNADSQILEKNDNALKKINKFLAENTKNSNKKN